ncbi:flavoprotein [Actinomyces wuliandei]|nr:flavoprotein [Actinomyces wuliandei]
MGNAPSVRASSLHLWITGSISASLVPYWMRWIIETYHGIHISATVSHAATRFVAPEAVHQIARDTGGWAALDDWDESGPTGRLSHADIAMAAEAFLVFPGTVNSVMSLACGLSSTPSMLALQVSEKPLVIAASFPCMNTVLSSGLEKLNERANVAFSPLVLAKGVSSGKWSELSGLFAPLVMAELGTLEEELYDGRRSE